MKPASGRRPGTRRNWHPRRYRALALMAAAVTGSTLLAGCFSGSGPSAAGLTPVTVMVTPGVANAPLFLGWGRGIFRAAGIRLVVQDQPAQVTQKGQPPQSSLAWTAKQEVSALDSGSADIAFSDYADMFAADDPARGGQRSRDIQVVADGYDCGPNVVEVLALPGSGITNPKQLMGAKVAVPAPDELPAKSQGAPVPFSQDMLFTWSALEGDNVNPARVHWVPVDPTQPPGLAGAISPRQNPNNPNNPLPPVAQAIVAEQPDISNVETTDGAVPVLDACASENATNGMPLDGYFTSSVFARTHAALLGRFRSALAKAQAAAAASPSGIDGVLRNADNIQSAISALVTVGTYPTTLDAQSLQRVASLMTSLSALPQQPPFSAGSLIAR